MFLELQHKPHLKGLWNIRNCPEYMARVLEWINTSLGGGSKQIKLYNNLVEVLFCFVVFSQGALLWVTGILLKHRFSLTWLERVGKNASCFNHDEPKYVGIFFLPHVVSLLLASQTQLYNTSLLSFQRTLKVIWPDGSQTGRSSLSSRENFKSIYSWVMYSKIFWVDASGWNRVSDL